MGSQREGRFQRDEDQRSRRSVTADRLLPAPREENISLSARDRLPSRPYTRRLDADRSLPLRPARVHVSVHCSQPLAARGARARATEWSRSRRYAEAGTAWSKDTASRSIAASSAARASRSFSAGVSGGSRMAGTIARVGGRASRTRSVDYL